MSGHVPDAGAFLARLVRLAPDAPVRLRRADGDRTALWGRLPWGVLVTREVAWAGPADATVAAAELLDRLAAGDPALPPRRDALWRWALPPDGGRVVERVPVAELARLAGAAAATLREVAAGGLAGRSVGSRVVRDALLDHAALTVTSVDAGTVVVPQRLVQAVARMGFLGPADRATAAGVARASGWTGLCAPFGTAWWQPTSMLTVVPRSHPPKG